MGYATKSTYANQEKILMLSCQQNISRCGPEIKPQSSCYYSQIITENNSIENTKKRNQTQDYQKKEEEINEMQKVNKETLSQTDVKRKRLITIKRVLVGTKTVTGTKIAW